MRIAIFCHSVVSDWNHGNAHFLRGIATELLSLGHAVEVHEPRNAWSIQGLIAEAGEAALRNFSRHYPDLKVTRYQPDRLDLERVLEGVNLVLVHEWNEPALVRSIGRVRQQSPEMVALFHDTHHRTASNFTAIAAMDLRDYDGALLFGRSLADIYQRHCLVRRTWVWHEAADTRVFYPRPTVAPVCDVAWIGNWGDEERSAELREFLLEPIASLGLRGVAYGVRFPPAAVQELEAAGIEYRGWLPNFEVPLVLASSKITVHVPRRPYVRRLPGVPTIRVFEALACGTPLVCAPWRDVEDLFEPGCFEVAEDGDDMKNKMRAILDDPNKARDMSERGLSSIQRRHSCAHRATELLEIYNELAHLSSSCPAAVPDAASANTCRSSAQVVSKTCPQESQGSNSCPKA